MRRNGSKALLAWMASVIFGAAAPAADAEDKPAIEFTGSGFVTLAAGAMLGGTKDGPDINPRYLGYRGPHYISDWAQGGVYEDDGLQYKPDTRLGLQGSVIFNPQLSLTTQVVARGARDGKANLEWLYGSYKVDDNLTVQVGRKRLPILYYSESQDIGISYPWVHLPADLYGWQVVNYNGANLMYSDRVGDWHYTANVFAGAETNKDAGYQKMYNGKASKTKVRWTDIRGGELILSQDWFESRIGYFQNNVENGVTGTANYAAKFRQKIYTLAFVIDYRDWLVRNEYYVGDLSKAEEKDYAQVFAVGYRIGKFTPMLTYSNYDTKYSVGGPLFGYTSSDEERHDTRSLSLRYDLGSSSTLKLQLDSYRDRSGTAFRARGNAVTGDSRLLTVSYDKVF